MLQRTISRENSSSNFHLSHLENCNICTCRAFLFLSLYCTVIVYLAWLCSDYPGQTRHNPPSVTVCLPKAPSATLGIESVVNKCLWNAYMLRE